MHFKSITLRNFLSFGPDAEEIPLGKLNVLVGINGSGKSNLLEAFSVLKSTPRDLDEEIRKGGGIKNWCWRKGAKDVRGIQSEYYPVIDSVVSYFNDLILHEIHIRDYENLLSISEEHISSILEERTFEGESNQSTLDLYSSDFLHTSILVLNKMDGTRKRIDLGGSDLNFSESVLSQLKDRSIYPEITRLGEFYSQNIFLYREWNFGRNSVLRRSQPSDLRKTWLEPDFSNLFLVLSTLQQNYPAKKEIIEALKGLNPDINDFGVSIDGSYLHAYIVEGTTDIPAVRLSDGTLRYLCLLAILLHPNPPSVVCIEEPELGLHPDIIPQLAEHLKSASKRCQLIVTTHSDLLIDAMSDRPECVLVCERDEKGTHIKPLNAEELAPWLEEYRLGQYWLRGGIGGVR